MLQSHSAQRLTGTVLVSRSEADKAAGQGRSHLEDASFYSGSQVEQKVLEYTSTWLWQALGRHVANMSCPDGRTNLDRNQFSGLIVSRIEIS